MSWIGGSRPGKFQTLRRRLEALDVDLRIGLPDEREIMSSLHTQPVVGRTAQRQLKTDCNFRTDRIIAAEIVEGRFGRRRAQLAREWEDIWQQQLRDRYPGEPH